MGKIVQHSVDTDLKEYVKADGGLTEVKTKLAQNTKKTDGYVSITEYEHLVVNGDWSDAIDAAIAYVRTSVSGKRLPIFFPPNRTYVTTRPINLYWGMIWYSTMNNSEFGNKAIIKNTVSDIFNFPNADVADVSIMGIEFQGNGTTKSTRVFQQQDHGTGYILQYSFISNCGFNFFANVIKGRILGTKIQKCYINNGMGSLELSGSDSIISENLIDNASAIPNANGLVVLTALSLSRFENNYLTGSLETGKGCIPLKVIGGQGLIVSKNWFDYSQGSGLHMESAEGHTIRDNFFRQNVKGAFAQYDAIITVFDGKNLLFSGNQFIDEPVGVNTFSLRKTTTGSSNITIRDNVYKSGYTFKLNTPAGESSDIFIDEPTTTYNKGKMWYGTKWDTPIKLPKSYTGLSLAFGVNGTVNAQSSRTYGVTVPDNIPADAFTKVRFWSATPLEDGIICEALTDGTTTVTLKFTNIKSTNVTMADKQFNLTMFSL